jgi:hypothetical protein
MRKRARNTRRRFTWGGARTGAGRPPSGPHSSEPHKKRPALAYAPDLGHAVRVSARFEPGIRQIDRDAIDRALELSRARVDFQIVELVVRRDRLELVIAAVDQRALARGMQGFQVSAARGINRAARRRGRVFADRYRVGVTPRSQSTRVRVVGRARADIRGQHTGR